MNNADFKELRSRLDDSRTKLINRGVFVNSELDWSVCETSEQEKLLWEICCNFLSYSVEVQHLLHSALNDEVLLWNLLYVMADTICARSGILIKVSGGFDDPDAAVNIMFDPKQHLLF